MCNIGQEILEQKSRSLRYKLRNSNSGKIDIFAKGLTSGIGQKWPILNLFFLGNIGQENVVYDILERKRAFLRYKNNKFKKSKNSNFLKRVNTWFWSRNVHFSNFFFLGNIGQENVFYDILEGKKAFLRYKNKKFENSKNWNFLKAVNLWFWSKNGYFSQFFFLDNIGIENVFYDILERNNVFLGYKKKKFKKSKNSYFSQGVNQWYWPKMAILKSFF